MRSRVLAVVVALATTATVLTGLPAPASAASTVDLEVRGYGHGRGLSQWGAQKRAQAGQTRAEILRFYYPGTSVGRASGSIKVLLTADVSDDVVVVDRAGLRVRSLGNGKTYSLDSPSAAQQWRITAASSARSTLSWRLNGGAWRYYRTLPGMAEISAPNGQPVTLVTGAGKRAYRGALRSTWPSSSTPNTRDTVNVVPLESYLRGVVPREVYTSWEPAALQAQSVAARTYALYEKTDNASDYFQVYDTTRSQVYGGSTDEVASTDRAIAATAGQVLLYGGKPAFTEFSASNGGWTVKGAFPYIVAREDRFDTTYQSNADSVTSGEIEAVYGSEIGSFTNVGTIRRNGNGAWGGRVTEIDLVGTDGTKTVEGPTFRTKFGLNSTWFRLVPS